MFFTLFSTLVSSDKMTLIYAQSHTFEYSGRWTFICLNPTDFYGFVRTPSDPNRGYNVLKDTGYWVVEFTNGGKLYVQNQNNIVKTMYYWVVQLKGQCTTRDYILNPPIGHYFAVANWWSDLDEKRNVTMPDYQVNFCVYYLGPATYTIRTTNNLPYNTAISINSVSKTSYTTTDVCETGYLLEYASGTTSPSGYAIVQITGLTYIDQKLDTGMVRAKNFNVLEVNGETARQGSLTTLEDFDHGLHLTRTQLLLILGGLIVLLIILISSCICCCCCCKSCCYYCGDKEENYYQSSSLQSELVSNPETNPYRI